MKKIFTIIFGCAALVAVHAQNNISSPIGVYGPLYATATTIGNGGSILVGDGGNWGFGGNIAAADKGNDNTPNNTGRSEKITFSGTGTYSNAAIGAGVSGNIIDGYAGVSGQPATFILPIGTGSNAYPLSVPAAVSVTAAYFSGSGSTQNKPVDGISANTTEYSPYLDIDAISAGAYTFSYPSGFSSGPSSYILESGNSSSSGTSGTTEYNLVTGVDNFSESANSATVTMTKSYTATQIYFAVSNPPLPIALMNFKAASDGKAVNLTWNTYTEVNNKGFSIQRSTGGANFSIIGFIPSNAVGGNSSAMLSYSFEDSSPVLGVVNYYRLLQTDIDGHVTYSPNVQVSLPASDIALQVYPSPARGSVTLKGQSIGSLIEIISVDGHILKKFNASAVTQKIDVSNLPSGIYFIKELSKDGNNTSAKFIIR